MEILSTSTAETQRLAQAIAQKVKPGMVLALFGDLGSGKTTFTAYLVKALGFDSRVQSPTFVIHREYRRSSHASSARGYLVRLRRTPDSLNPHDSDRPITTQIKVVHHVDLYRLTLKEDVLDIGLSEMLQESDSLVLIEWPELAMEILPPDVVKLYFTTTDKTTRRIIIEGLEIPSS